VNRPDVAAILLAAAAAGSVLVVARQWAQPVPAPTSEQICSAATNLQDALDLSSVGDQAVLRARGAHLADLLTAASPKDGPQGSASVAQGIVAVLDDPRATVADLAGAIAPIVGECSG
jgi:hypothetical protein